MKKLLFAAMALAISLGPVFAATNSAITGTINIHASSATEYLIVERAPVSKQTTVSKSDYTVDTPLGQVVKTDKERSVYTDNQPHTYTVCVSRIDGVNRGHDSQVHIYKVTANGVEKNIESYSFAGPKRSGGCTDIDVLPGEKVKAKTSPILTKATIKYSKHPKLG